MLRARQLAARCFVAPLLLLALVVFPAAAQKPAKGKVQKGVYQAPGTTFSVPVPKGFKVLDTHWSDHGAVSFHDEFGRLVAIHYATAPAELQAAGQEPSTTRESLAAWLRGFALDYWFKAGSPESRILADTLGTFEGMPALFALIDAPGAHTMEVMTMRDGRMQRKREDARRVGILFAKGGRVYLLMTETATMGLFETTKRAEPDEDWVRRGDALTGFYRSISFRE